MFKRMFVASDHSFLMSVLCSALFFRNLLDIIWLISAGPGHYALCSHVLSPVISRAPCLRLSPVSPEPEPGASVGRMTRILLRRLLLLLLLRSAGQSGESPGREEREWIRPRLASAGLLLTIIYYRGLMSKARGWWHSALMFTINAAV